MSWTGFSSKAKVIKPEAATNKPITISAVKELPKLTAIVDAISSGLLYSIKFDETQPKQVIVTFAQPQGMQRFLTRFEELPDRDAMETEIAGQKMTVRVASNAPEFTIPAILDVQIKNYDATRVVILSRPISSEAPSFSGDDILVLDGVLRVRSVPADHPISRKLKREAFMIEFDSIEAAVTFTRKMGKIPKFVGWKASYGQDPCGKFEKESAKGKFTRSSTQFICRLMAIYSILVTGTIPIPQIEFPTEDLIAGDPLNIQPAVETQPSFDDILNTITSKTPPSGKTYEGPDLMVFEDKDESAMPKSIGTGAKIQSEVHKLDSNAGINEVTRNLEKLEIQKPELPAATLPPVAPAAAAPKPKSKGGLKSSKWAD